MYSAASGADPRARDQFLTLVRERRLEVVSAQTEVTPSVRGDQAHAEFDAVLNWRTPFGGNRRREARFIATFDSRDGEWRMVSCALAPGVELK